ncbi:DUF7219 family protein [Crocosphaera sp. Alani8]|uniref:DUF7219 family protein n=1 Tax=Crocosphaera sp. Alani8 TaxID=3038952 RepID=UPI00313D98F9
MDNKLAQIKQDFLYPISPYHGLVNENDHKNQFLNLKIQEFAQKIGFIANLHTAGKLPSAKAYDQLESLWKEIESIERGLINHQQN